MYMSKQELAFVQHQTHRELLSELLGWARKDREVRGVLLTGSVARGDAYPGSDLDLYILLAQECTRPFEVQIRRGVMVELSYNDLKSARAKLESKPMEVYRYLDGHILYDPAGYLGGLVEIAKARFREYESSAKERRGIAHWLRSVRIKVVAALEVGDMLKAAYLTSTNSFEVLVALWAINNKPVPPGGAVLAHLGDLCDVPERLEESLQGLFLGEDFERSAALLSLIDWAVPILDGG